MQSSETCCQPVMIFASKNQCCKALPIHLSLKSYQSCLDAFHSPEALLFPSLAAHFLSNSLLWQLVQDVKHCITKAVCIKHRCALGSLGPCNECVIYTSTACCARSAIHQKLTIPPSICAALQNAAKPHPFVMTARAVRLLTTTARIKKSSAASS